MEVSQDSIFGPQLPVHVRQLPAGVAEEEPSSDAVVRGAQVQKEHQDRQANRQSVMPEDPGLVRRQKRQLARQPGDGQEGGQRRQERDVGDHCLPSSNA